MMAKYDAEIKNLKCKIDSKDIELINLKTQLTELRDKNTKLQSEMKLRTHQLWIDGTRRCKQGNYRTEGDNIEDS